MRIAICAYGVSTVSVLRELKAYPALLRAYWARALEYRFQAILWFLVGTYPLVMMAVWISIAQGRDGTVGGYAINDFIGYYLAVAVVKRFTHVWILDDFEDGVRKGELSPYLLRPMDFIHHILTRVFTARLMQVIVAGLIALVVVLLVPGQQFHFMLPNTLFFLMALAVGFGFEFCLQYLVGCSAFWTTQASRIFDVVFFVKSFFGGFVVPLAMLPPALQTLARWLPFQSAVGLPAEILIGRTTTAQALMGVGISLAWSLLITLIARRVWFRGLKSYSAVGA